MIHCTGQEVPAERVAAAAERVTGVRVFFDGPRTALDYYLFAAGVEENRLFAAHRFRFEENYLARIIGRDVSSAVDPLSEDALARLIEAYRRRLEHEQSTLHFSPLLRPSSRRFRGRERGSLRRSRDGSLGFENRLEPSWRRLSFPLLASLMSLAIRPGKRFLMPLSEPASLRMGKASPQLSREGRTRNAPVEDPSRRAPLRLERGRFPGAPTAINESIPISSSLRRRSSFLALIPSTFPTASAI